jgi:hypothetical protein
MRQFYVILKFEKKLIREIAPPCHCDNLKFIGCKIIEGIMSVHTKLYTPNHLRKSVLKHRD